MIRGMPIRNAVQPPAWYRALPRASYTHLEKISTVTGWFEVYRLPHNVLAMYEPGHFQEVISFLVIGDSRALLLDTGMGIGDMRALVAELTDLPLIVGNSHCHFDHIGCNYQFEAVHIFDHAGAIARLKRGMTTDEIVHHLAGDSTARPYPDGFDPAAYSIPPSNPVPFSDGDHFDLGGRRLEVIHTPGHSPDGVMLIDRANSVLLAGDTFYPATMYAHLTSDDGIDSNFTDYRRTMRMLADTVSVNSIYTSHNEPIVPSDSLHRAAEAFDRIADGSTPYEVDEEGLRKYSFDGFAIVTLDPSVENDA